jgi:uncharacterized protein YprB with RNaseH-like and TPR domain
MTDGPAILFYDIETTPLLGYTWRQYDTNIIAGGLVQDWKLATVAWAWGDGKVRSLPGEYPNDSVLVDLTWELFDQADIVVAHNGNSFDQRKARARMIAAEKLPPTPYHEVDTMREAKKVGSWTSAGLAYLVEHLSLEHKLQSGGFQTWLGYMAGDRKATNQLLTYNEGDVVSLRELYYRLRPWMTTGHPNLGLWHEGQLVCTNCASPDVVRRGYQQTRVSRFQRYVCNNCGKWSRVRTRESQRFGKGVKLT